VLPFFEEQGVPLLRVLTDRGSEYCGSIEHHEYQLYLALEDIDHSKTEARHPQTNGICERFHRTMKDEFYSIAFRKKIYHSLEELQHDVDEWLVVYNHQRPHSGRYGCVAKNHLGYKYTERYFSSGGNIEEIGHESNLSANVAFPDSFNLSLPDHVHGLIAADGPPRRVETEKAKSGIDSAFYESVILLDDIIEIFALA